MLPKQKSVLENALASLYDGLMKDSIFTQIIKGEIPCHKIYEDDKILAFLDVSPLTPGHTLVIPKQQISHFDDLDDALYTALFLVVKRVAKRIKKVTGSERACVRVEGFNVPHTHVHVYPCNTAKEFYGDQNRLHTKPNYAELAEMAKKLSLL